MIGGEDERQYMVLFTYIVLSIALPLAVIFELMRRKKSLYIIVLIIYTFIFFHSFTIEFSYEEKYLGEKRNNYQITSYILMEYILDFPLGICDWFDEKFSPYSSIYLFLPNSLIVAYILKEIRVFSTRSPDRPNPLGLHRVTVLEITGDRFKVRSIEAIDGTSVVDIKPVLLQSVDS